MQNLLEDNTKVRPEAALSSLEIWYHCRVCCYIGSYPYQGTWKRTDTQNCEGAGGRIVIARC